MPNTTRKRTTDYHKKETMAVHLQPDSCFSLSEMLAVFLSSVIFAISLATVSITLITSPAWSQAFPLDSSFEESENLFDFDDLLLWHQDLEESGDYLPPILPNLEKDNATEKTYEYQDNCVKNYGRQWFCHKGIQKSSPAVEKDDQCIGKYDVRGFCFGNFKKSK